MKNTTKKNRTRVHLCATVAVLCTLLTGCSEFTAEQVKSENARAVASPPDIMSPIGEVYDMPSGAMPLVVVNTGKTGQPAQVVTVLDPFLNNGPATRPAIPSIKTPTGVNLSANPGDVLEFKVVQQGKPQDRFSISSDHDAVPTLTITSPTGSGSMVLERIGDIWPATVNLHLQNPDGVPITSVKNITAAEVVDDQHHVPLKAATTQTPGSAQIAIPGATRSKQITVEWQNATP